MKTLTARRRHPLAGLVVVAFALLLFGGAYAALSPSAQAADSPSSAATIAAGKGLFLTNCSSCHGINGQSQLDSKGNVLGPSLIGTGYASCDFQVGTGRMPVGNEGAQIEKHNVIYTPAQIDQLCNYVASFGPGPAEPTADQYSSTGLNPSKIASGGELFRYNCSQCHGAAAGGGALANGAYAPAIRVSAKYIYEAMLSGPQQMPVFSDATLPPEQKKEIIAYLHTLRASPNSGGIGFGRLGTVTEGLIGWLVGIGGIVLIAVWLTVKGVRA